ncbi:nucleotide-diphospho-sugar transferase [Rhizoclosmatium globosum]|uniref:UDP-N-acetylglucosamine diphosphorylase n=1 Tax=Rhizoclosmatium globosum TaxID=329046 RepID=A0A1Y2D316_9FUNG|nr:nucleotide-diphospho-sugar transferase [Rhizoclosmatium globosum]|eukprot:ORY53534.1 nucleotide-diphospho-sugar transferase [Rhizoclosmatium globosum]
MFLPDISNVVNSAVATENQLRATFTNAGQGHVFQYFDTLSSEGKASLLAQLADIDVDRCNRIFAKATSPQTCSNSIEPLPADSFSSTINPSEVDSIKDWRATGLKLIAEGKVAVILLAGGQGTRLGSSAPKGCYDINLPSHKSLFQLQAERILSIQRIARNAYPESQGTGIIPWYVMTSGPTRAATECFFKDNNFFGLLEENVMFFNQGVLPAFGMDGKILMEDKGVLATAPDGNGGIYKALKREGVLADLGRRAIPFVHAYCVDNCLVKVADPVFIGYCVAKKANCGAKVVPKQRASEPVGVVCLRNNKFAVVEYSEIPLELSNQLNADGKTLTYNAANIANHFYTTEFLNSIDEMEQTLEFHVAKKKIKHIDMKTGELVIPTTNNGIKLELFIFDVFPFVERMAVLETARKEEFSPLKNASGCKDGDSPETSRADILAQHKRFIEAAGGTAIGDVELSPLLTYDGEGLESLDGVTVKGPLVVSHL